jgi:hypothetical protein
MTSFVRPLQRRNVRVLHAAALSVQCSVRVMIAKGLLTRRRSKWILQASVKLLSAAPSWGGGELIQSTRSERTGGGAGGGGVGGSVCCVVL